MKNVLVTIAGILIFIVSYFASTVILGFITSVPLVANILAWPSTPDLYVMSGVATAGAGSTYAFVSRFANLTKNGKNVPAIIIGLLVLVIFGSEAIYRLVTDNGLTPLIGIVALSGLLLIFES